MSEEKPRPDASGPPGAIAPGRVSAFLAELARVPDADPLEILGAYRAGAVIGRFELLRELGRGGFGVVFEALDRELGRRVAFKAIRPGSRGSARLKEEWLRSEAEAAAQLSHPNIVQLHDFGIGPRGPYLVLELLEGETLQDRLQRGPLPVLDAVRISIEMARALAHSHAAGVLHRDLKPSNVFLAESGAVKVLDFGLAHVLGASRLQAGGTPSYMAPEQWREGPEDARTDVFAAGAILYEMLTGRIPYSLFGGRSAALDPGPAPVPRRPDLPRKVGALVSSAIARRQADRPANAQIWLDGLLVAERALVRAGRARARRAAYAGAIVLATAVAGAGFHAWRQARLPPPAERPTVAVADFANETGDGQLDGLSGMFITSLEQSRRLSVLTRSRMLDLARQVAGERPERIDEVMGREVARRARAAGVATGTIRRLGTLYAIDVQVTDPISNEYLVTARERTSRKEEIPDAIDRLSNRVRAGLKERSVEIETSRVRVAEATTGSLAAYEHFSRAEGLLELQQATDEPAHAAAREEYRRAVALAPDFAMAHYRIAYTLNSEHMEGAARAALARALDHLDRAAPKERAYIQALAARMDGRALDAIRQYREILDRYPGEKEAWVELAFLMASRDMGYDHVRAAEYARKALELAPDHAPAWEQLLTSGYARGEDAPLLEEAQRYARAVTSVGSWQHLGHAQLVAGRYADAEKTFRRMAETMTGSAAGPLGLALVRLQRLDLAGAEGEYRRLAAASDPKRAREGLFGLSWVSAYRGRYREAAARLDPVIRLDERLRDAPDLTRAYGQKALWLTLARGRLPEEVIQKGLAAIDPAVEPPLVYRHFYWFAIYAALAAGRLDRAKQLGDRGAEMGWTHSRSLLRMAEARALGRPDEARAVAEKLYSPRDLAQGLPLYLAQWALREGRANEAVTRAGESLAMPIFPPHPDVAGFRAAVWPRSLLLRARAHEAAGNRAAAKVDLERLLELWRSADRDAPDVVEARALRARLESRAR